MDEGQMTDLTRQIREGTPYPVKAVMAFGLNHRMFPEPHKILEAVDELEFVMSAELFMTDMCLNHRMFPEPHKILEGGRAGICHERGAVYDGHVPPLRYCPARVHIL